MLLNIFARQGMPRKFVEINRSLYSQTQGRVRVYGELSKSFPTRIGVHQGCPLSPFLFNFVIDEIMMQALEGLPKPGIHVITGEMLVDLEYANHIVLLFEDVQEAQSAFDELKSIVSSFGMRFAPSKCKAMFLDVDSNTPLKLQGEILEVVEQFTYLGSCVSSDGSLSNEINAQISKARIAFVNLRHLWRQKGMSEPERSRV